MNGGAMTLRNDEFGGGMGRGGELGVFHEVGGSNSSYDVEHGDDDAEFQSRFDVEKRWMLEVRDDAWEELARHRSIWDGRQRAGRLVSETEVIRWAGGGGGDSKNTHPPLI